MWGRCHFLFLWYPWKWLNSMEIKCLTSLQIIQNCSSDPLTTRIAVMFEWARSFSFKDALLLCFSPLFFFIKTSSSPFSMLVLEVKRVLYTGINMMYKVGQKCHFFQNNCIASHLVGPCDCSVVSQIWCSSNATLWVESKVSLRGCVGSSSSPHTLWWTV